VSLKPVLVPALNDLVIMGRAMLFQQQGHNGSCALMKPHLSSFKEKI
jgi:hypothetical protein